MIFTGSFLCGDELSVPLTATNVNNITTMSISNAWFDGLYVTTNTDFEMKDMPTTWDFDTVLYAAFDGNTLAGNLTIALAKISHLLIKKKRADDFKWTTIEVREVNNDLANMNIIGKDYTSEIGATYEYAAVPSLNGVESLYSVSTADCESDRLVIIDADEVWVTYLTDGNCDYTRTYPINMLQTLYNKYPTSVRNSFQNYDVINVEGSWVPTESDDNCALEYEDDHARIIYQKAFVDFLTNDKPKILKNVDGRTWLCMLSGDVSDSADSIYNNRKISFQMTEIGTIYNHEDLYEAGFNQTVTEEWW